MRRLGPVEAFLERCQRTLAARRERGNLRVVEPPMGDLVDFSSNDYLGLARCSAFGTCIQQGKRHAVGLASRKWDTEVISVTQS
jgi:7-keto-8-aminopelargonate synthetase-like enzyme